MPALPSESEPRIIEHSSDRGKEKFDAKSPLSVIGAAVYALLNGPSAIPAVIRNNFTCSRSHLAAGTGVYQGWFFAGDNPAWPPQDFAKGDVSMFQGISPLRALAERPGGPFFEALPQIRHRMIDLVRACVTRVEMDNRSRDMFQEAQEIAADQDRKLVILGTHSSHFDALAFEAAIYEASQKTYGLDAPGIARFLCGAYMYYTPAVRPFTPAHHSLFVFGPHDAKAVTQSLKEIPATPESSTREDSREGLNALRFLRDAVVAGYGNRQEEMLVVFPYAGRGTGDYKPFGIKSALPPEIGKQLSNPQALYLPVSIMGSDRILETGRDYGIFGQINALARSALRVEVGKPVRGEEMDLFSLHQDMCRISFKNLSAFCRQQKIPMPSVIPQEILEAAKTE